jgi:N-acetylmuramoyl-L-alanine amidase
MIKALLKILFLLMGFCLPLSLWSDIISTPSKSAILQLLEIKQRQQQTTLIFTLKNSSEPKMFSLENPNRLVIDFPQAKPSSTLPKEIHTNGLIQHIRLGKGPDGTGNLRLVLDLAAKSEYVFLIDQNPKAGQEIVTVILTKVGTSESSKKTEAKLAYHESLDIDELEQEIQASKTRQAAQKIAPLATGQADLIQPLNQGQYASIKNSPLKKVVIEIDPGHGGKDSGAIGPDRDMEKTVVLAISKKLQTDLMQIPGIDPRLTRKGDYFLTLRQRINLARRDNASMFMAIHADAFNETATGASVFALSEHGASSEMARWLADRENTSELSGINIKTKDRELKSVLLDMSQTATIEDSLRLGKNLLNSLRNLTNLHSNKVEQAGFVVLKSPDIPSVLVETGFISNPREEKLLTDPEYQARIAKALAFGITHYFQANPPPGSLFEMEYQAAPSTAAN